MSARRKRGLDKIAIDLTPVLPGGENGGARLFVEELVSQLVAQHPEVQFVLLTQAASHAELARLDCSNVERRQVVGGALRSSVLSVAESVLPRLPARLRQLVGRLGYAVNRILKRSGSRGLLREMGVDLLFCPFTAPTYWEPGLPTVCTLYDLQYRAHPEFFSAADLAHRDQAFREACRRANLLVAISDFARESAIEASGLIPERVRTVRLQMAGRLAEVHAQDGLDRRCGAQFSRYFLYPANFWEHKNHESLISAFVLAMTRGLPPDIGLVCTGAPGRRQAQLKALADDLGVGDRVLFPGYVSDADLAGLMRHALGLIFPSLYEGFGLPVIEAMALGVPVACSARASLPEVVGSAALLFDPLDPQQIASAMTTLALDRVHRQRLVSAGLLRSAEFTDAEGMAAGYWQAFLDASV